MFVTKNFYKYFEMGADLVGRWLPTGSFVPAPYREHFRARKLPLNGRRRLAVSAKRGGSSLALLLEVSLQGLPVTWTKAPTAEGIAVKLGRAKIHRDTFVRDARELGLFGPYRFAVHQTPRGCVRFRSTVSGETSTRAGMRDH
jgi:hypothetical protein